MADKFKVNQNLQPNNITRAATSAVPEVSNQNLHIPLLADPKASFSVPFDYGRGKSSPSQNDQNAVLSVLGNRNEGQVNPVAIFDYRDPTTSQALHKACDNYRNKKSSPASFARSYTQIARETDSHSETPTEVSDSVCQNGTSVTTPIATGTKQPLSTLVIRPLDDNYRKYATNEREAQMQGFLGVQHEAAHKVGEWVSPSVEKVHAEVFADTRAASQMLYDAVQSGNERNIELARRSIEIKYKVREENQARNGATEPDPDHDTGRGLKMVLDMPDSAFKGNMSYRDLDQLAKKITDDVDSIEVAASKARDPVGFKAFERVASYYSLGSGSISLIDKSKRSEAQQVLIENGNAAARYLESDNRLDSAGARPGTVAVVGEIFRKTQLLT